MKTISLKKRKHLVETSQFGKIANSQSFVENLPNILASKSLKKLIESIKKAKKENCSIIWAIGGHVIKSGVTPYLIAMMREGYISHIAMNGACVIHDFEIAYCGSTSEDVAESIKDGSFGMATETSEILNKIMCSDKAITYGIGHAVGKEINSQNLWHRSYSLLANASLFSIPVSVHVALGTDVTHCHPYCDWSKLANACKKDYEHFVNSVENLNNGGVFINAGSAVILPEVFIKTVSLIRNQNKSLSNFTSAVLDMNDHYRPRENVLKRPGGCPIKLIGHHEIMIPLITGSLINC